MEGIDDDDDDDDDGGGGDDDGDVNSKALRWFGVRRLATKPVMGIMASCLEGSWPIEYRSIFHVHRGSVVSSFQQIHPVRRRVMHSQ